MTDDNSRPIYSTEHGRLCPECGKPEKNCICRELKRKATPAGDGVARVGRETKGRGGKCVTLVKGLCVTADTLEAVAKKLKQRCGCGGTVREGVIEIQGDHRETIVAELGKLGYTAKVAGG